MPEIYGYKIPVPDQIWGYKFPEAPRVPGSFELGGYKIPIWVCAVPPVAYIWYKWQTWTWDYFAKKGIPNPPPTLMLGNIGHIIKRGVVVSDTELAKEYGKIYGFFNFREPILMISDLDMLKEILVKDFQHFQNHTVQEATVSQYVTRKMITSLEFDHWKHVRNTLTPTFSGGKLRLMNGGLNICCHNLVKYLDSKGRLDEVIDVKVMFGNFTMDVIASSTFGIEADSQVEGSNSQFAVMGRKIINQFSSFKSPKILLLIFCPWVFRYFKLDLFPSDSKKFFLGVINESLKRRGEGEKSAKDFLQLMVNVHVEDPKPKDLKDNQYVKKNSRGALYSTKGLTHEEILAQAFLFFLAGFDTTANTLTFLAYNLATHPDCQEKLYQEIVQVMDGKADPDYDMIKQMPYLQMCIEETLRMYPVAPRIDRASSDDVVVNGLKIDKGTTVGISIWCIHHDPDIWPDPDEFIPERFTAEEKAARHPMAWMPFGQGPRNCIGMRLALMEMKFAIIHILRNFRLVTCEETQIPLVLHQLRMEGEKGIKLKVEKR